jgi:hypothetical protein
LEEYTFIQVALKPLRFQLERLNLPAARSFGSSLSRDMASEIRSEKGNPQSLKFYDVQPDIIKDSARKLLLEYSHVPEGEIDRHVESIVSVLVTLC